MDWQRTITRRPLSSWNKRDRRPSSLISTFLIYCSWATSKSLRARHWIMPVRLLLSIRNRLMHTTCAERRYSNSNGTRRLAMSSSAPPNSSLRTRGLTFCSRRSMTVWGILSRSGCAPDFCPAEQEKCDHPLKDFLPSPNDLQSKLNVSRFSGTEDFPEGGAGYTFL